MNKKNSNKLKLSQLINARFTKDNNNHVNNQVNNNNLGICSLEIKDINYNNYLVINNFMELELYNKLLLVFPSIKDIFLNDINRNISNYLMLNNYRYTYKFNILELDKNNKLKIELNQLIIDFLKNICHKLVIDNFKDVYNSSSRIIDLNLELSFISPVSYIDNTNNIEYIKYRKSVEIKEIPNNVKLVSWYFLRNKEDNSIGGNLEIYKNNIPIINVPYQSNTLVVLKISNTNNNQNNSNIYSYRIYSRSLTIYTQKFIKFIIT
jgi:hypothetical protein